MKKLFFIALCGFIISGCSAEKDKAPEVVIKKEDPKKLIENLFVAVLDSDEQSVQTLLENPDTEVNAYDDRGQTALMRAAQIDSSPYIIELLISSGAKVFQTRESSTETAFDDVNPSNVAISKLFTKEKDRLSKTIEDLIVEESFSEADQFVRESYLPYNLTLPESELNPLKLALKSLSSNDEAGKRFIVSELSRFVESGEDVAFIMRDGLSLTTKVKDIEFLGTILDALTSNSDATVYGYQNGDFDDVGWLTQKINLVTQYNLGMPVAGYTELFVSALNNTQRSGDKEKFLALNKALQKSKTDDYSKSLVLQQVLLETERNIKNSPDRIKWIPVVVNDWKSGRQSIEATGYQFDEHTLLVLESLAGKDIILSELDEIFTSLATFAPSFENRSEESIKFIISTEEYEFIDKKRILEMLLKRTQVLPEQIVSYAIEHGGVPAIELLLKADIPFSPESQAQSVLTAIEKTNSGDAAYGILVLLNENGIAFDTEYGKQALSLTITKLWSENNATYRSVYDYLISLPNSPVVAMSDAEIVGSLKNLLQYVRLGRADWPQVTQFVERIKNPISEETSYKREGVTFGASEAYDIDVSFFWDFLMEAYDILKTQPSDSDIMLVTARKIAEKFPNDHYSFSFVGDEFFKNPSFLISQNILSLAVLLTIEKDTIKEALNTPDELAYSRIVETVPSNFSWDHFLGGEPYKYYSQNKTFWSSIVDIFLESGKKYPFDGNKHHVLFAKVLAHSGKLNRFPELGKQLKESDISFFDHQKVCVLQKSEYDQADIPRLAVEHNNGTVAGTTGYRPSWVNLGSFEALTPYMNKTCKSQGTVTTAEADIIRSFVLNNLDKPQAPGEFIVNPFSILTPKKTKICSEVNDFGPSNFIFNYDLAGSVLIRTDGNSTGSGASSHEMRMLLSGFPFGEECYVFEYNYYAAYKAKTVFLNNWFQCAVDNSDDALVRIFESLDPEHNVNPTNDNDGIHFCRW